MTKWKARERSKKASWLPAFQRAGRCNLDQTSLVEGSKKKEGPILDRAGDAILILEPQRASATSAMMFAIAHDQRERNETTDS